VRAGCSGKPVQRLFEVDGRPLALVTRQLQVVGQRIDDLQATAMLTDRGQRVVSEGKPVRLGLAEAAAPISDSTVLDSTVLDGGDAAVQDRPPVPAAGVDDLDGAPAILGAHLHLVLLTRSGVLDDVGTGLSERQGDVGARIRRDAESLQAAVENLAAYRHAEGITGKVEHQLDFHATHL
jgi:hypothetical protein